ncbi:MAG TPA: polysaccharide deacetylase family protein [Gemmatimonadaceae bacterium]|nr:polysaccharide deacetylase family protein [Gemmatimonadaceae bacterium]
MKAHVLAAIGCCVALSSGAAQQPSRPPNENGRIPVLEYHLVTDRESRWSRSVTRFRRDLEVLYERGYRPITVAQLVDGDLDIPAGTSPVVFTFDDASPSQFRYIEKDGKLEVDPQSAVGVWLAFNRDHPDWKNRATFCMLSGAAAGHAFFGEKGIEGQKSAWRFEKLRYLSGQGFELCAHTLWHANLSKYSDRDVQEQIARNVMAIDSAVPGYRVRTFALPLGEWPKNRALAATGAWHNPRNGADVRYAFDAILEVSGPPVPSPASDRFNPLALTRIQVTGNALESVLDQLDRKGERFVSSGPGHLLRRRRTASDR